MEQLRIRRRVGVLKEKIEEDKYINADNGNAGSLTAILIALTFHEYAHGKVLISGDDTPYYQGRLPESITPYRSDRLCHVIYISLCWAKPVRLTLIIFACCYKKGMMLVSLAGSRDDRCWPGRLGFIESVVALSAERMGTP
jgi:hypothetical protein